MTLGLLLKRNFRKGTERHKQRRTDLGYVQVYRKLPYFYKTQFSKIMYGNEALVKQQLFNLIMNFQR